MKIFGKMGASCVAAVVAMSMGAGVANAATETSLSIAGNEGLEGTGAFTGSISYNQVSQQLTIQLTNESPDTNNFIVGFVFNAATDVTLQENSFPSDQWNLWTNPEDNISFGTYEWGAGLIKNNGDPTNDMNDVNGPSRGIAFNNTGEWVFDVLGDDASSTVANDFMSQLSTGNNGIPAAFVVRFMGGESDTVPGHVVPLPAAAWGGLALLGMLGVGHGLRKRRLAREA